jgi:hypothetical protein
MCIWPNPCGYSRCCLCPILSFTDPPSYPPSLGTVLLPVLFRGHLTACSTMRALTPAGPSQDWQVSPLTPLCLPGIPIPTTLCARTSRFLITTARTVRPDGCGLSPCRRTQASPFARRLAALTPPKRIRHPTGCWFASGCSPPRLAATQLPSATCAVTPHGTDLHRADKASSRTHERGLPPALLSITSDP